MRLCRFNFTHFVKIRCYQEYGGRRVKVQKLVARVGKDLVLPRAYRAKPPPMFGANGLPIPIRPEPQLGASIVLHTLGGRRGRIEVVHHNPLEGSSNSVAQVTMRCNVDVQTLLRVVAVPRTGKAVSWR